MLSSETAGSIGNLLGALVLIAMLLGGAYAGMSYLGPCKQMFDRWWLRGRYTVMVPSVRDDAERGGSELANMLPQSTNSGGASIRFAD